MSPTRIVLGALLCTALSACQLFSPADEAGGTPGVRLGDGVVPTHYRLDLSAVPSDTDFSGEVAIAVEVASPRKSIHLNARDLRVSETWYVTRDGERHSASFRQLDRTGVAELSFGDAIPSGPGVIEMRFSGALNTALESLYKVREEGRDYLFSQFQTTSARLLFPGFDEPGFKAPFSIRVTTASDQVVIGNMPVRREVDLGNGFKRVEFETSPPMPTYLLAFAIGPLDVADWADIPPNEIRDRPIPLRGIAAHDKGQHFEYALRHTAAILAEQERYFGLPFPYPKLDLIAAPDFHAGAMENIGAIVYREYYLLLDRNAPTRQRRHYAMVHAHELAHMWFGNLVTPKWWDDTWLNESFATWMAYRTVANWDPEGGYARETQHDALWAMNLDSLASARQIRQPIERFDDITNAFDGITYDKGGGVLSMFENYLGVEAFREGVRTHIRRFSDGNADADDFMKSLAMGSGNAGVVPAFQSFINQPGVPQLTVRAECGAEPALRVTQTRYRPLGSTISGQQTWQIPFCARVVDGQGIGRHCALVTEASQRIPLPSGRCPDAILPNADGAGYYRFALDDAGFAAIAENAADFNAAELIAYADSVMAAFRAGQVEFTRVLEAATLLARHPEWDVAIHLIDPIVELADRMFDAGQSAALRQWLIRTYAPRAAVVGLDEGGDVGQTLLREKLVDVLALTARYEPLRTELAARARRYIGNPDRPRFRPNVLAADITDTALAVAVQKDPRLGRRLLAALPRVNKSVPRRDIIRAAARTPELAEETRDLASGELLRDNEVRTILYTQHRDGSVRDGMWDWLRANFELVSSRTPDWGQGGLISYASQFCDEARMAEVREFFAPRVDQLTGGPRRYASTLESIELCRTLRAGKLAEIAAAISR